MYVGVNQVRIWTDTNRNHVLRSYARWEYGSPDPSWLLAAPRPRARKRRSRGWAKWIRYFVNSFRGFAAFDLRGADGRRST